MFTVKCGISVKSILIYRRAMTPFWYMLGSGFVVYVGYIFIDWDQ